MTLTQWAEQSAYLVRQHPNGAMWVPDVSINDHIRPLLWRLEDYIVSSVSGGSIWLVPRG